MSALKVRQGSGLGHYDLLLDGERVGEVWKMEQRYNLARPLTVTYWRLKLTGIDLPLDAHYRTRAEAVERATGLLGFAS